MKKFYLFLSVMLLTLVSVGLVSCGDDKDEPKGSDLVGTWQLKAIDEDGGSYETLVQFTKNGNWNSVEIYKDGSEIDIDVERGTYTVSGDRITVKYTEDGKTYTESLGFEVKGDKLMLTYDDYPVAVVFARVKDSVIEKYL